LGRSTSILGTGDYIGAAELMTCEPSRDKVLNVKWLPSLNNPFVWLAWVAVTAGIAIWQWNNYSPEDRLSYWGFIGLTAIALFFSLMIREFRDTKKDS
jgi:hypothetical protein